MDAYVSKPVELDDIRAVLLAVAKPASTPDPAQSEDDDIAVINHRRIAHLLEIQDENNPTLVSGIIELFFADSPKHLENLAEAIRAADAETSRIRRAPFPFEYRKPGRPAHAQILAWSFQRLGRAGTVEGASPFLEQLREEFLAARQRLAGVGTSK